MHGDGDGWTTCAQGHRHWGRHGAAGLLLRAVDEHGEVRVLLQHRAAWSHDGDTWGVPGGARDSHEDAATTALRETAEEAALDPAPVTVRWLHTDDHGGWSYTTAVADTPAPLPVRALRESADVAWVAEAAVDGYPLHPGFARSWPALHAAAVTLVVDAANVVGARPDGWWRDRAGAARRLAAALEALRARTTRQEGAGAVVVRRVLLVVEGAARAVAGDSGPRWVEVRAARGAGDDLVHDLAVASTGAGEQVLVVTADRELRRRVGGVAAVAGPGWLLDLLAPAPPRPAAADLQ